MSLFRQTFEYMMQTCLLDVRVLVIDDNYDITSLLLKYLNSKGIDTTVANDPLDGLRKIKQKNYDAVILDIFMPGLNGMEIIQKLENENILQEQKIIIFSAVSFTQSEFHYLLKKEGIAAFLSKPITLREIVTAISS